MKKIIHQLFLLFALLVVDMSCKKPSQANSAPVVDAGPDIRLEIPRTHTSLTGAAYDADGNIKSYKWRKVAGPESYFIEWADNLSPKLIWLEEGDYEFEVTATDREELSDTDTIKVTVFSNLKKHVINNLTPDASGFSTAQISADVFNNIKWVFCKAGTRCEQADAGPLPGIDYNAGAYYYELSRGNTISVFAPYTGSNIDVIIYY